MHSQGLLLVLVHVCLLLVVVGQELLLIHVIEWRRDSVLAEAAHLVWSEVHHSLIHAVAVLVMVETLIHVQAKLHVGAVR